MTLLPAVLLSSSSPFRSIILAQQLMLLLLLVVLLCVTTNNHRANGAELSSSLLMIQQQPRMSAFVVNGGSVAETSQRGSSSINSCRGTPSSSIGCYHPHRYPSRIDRYHRNHHSLLPRQQQQRRLLPRSGTVQLALFRNNNNQNSNNKNKVNSSSRKNKDSTKASSNKESGGTTTTIASTSLATSGQVLLSRRQSLEVGIAVAGTAITYIGTRENDPTDYGLWGLLPIGTYKRKPTIMETILPDTLWTFDQKFGILNVQVPLRMTIIKLQPSSAAAAAAAGPSSSSSAAINNNNNKDDDDRRPGLLVYNPIAATPQCMDMIQTLEQQYGPVRHIIVGSVALEHKVYASVLAQKCKQAIVWLTPGQYSFPINLSASPYLGYPSRRTKLIQQQVPLDKDWPQEFQYATLGPIISRDGAFAETVVLHQPTKTLLVTDTCLQVTDDVPLIYNTDPAPLLYHARDTITDIVSDTPETRKKGWKRSVLFGLYFMPSAIKIKDVSTALAERRTDINPDFAGIYPWDWVGDENASWYGLTGNGKPLVAPILQVLLLNRSPVEVLDFADTVAQWDVVRIIPAHLKNNLQFTARDYRAAFGFLEERGVPPGFPIPLAADLQTLRDAEISLIQSGAIVAAPPKVGGAFSRAEILAQTTYRCRSGICAPKSQA